MDRTIRVRGQANVKVRPDYVYVCMNCETLDMDYENAMHTAAQTVERLKDALEKVCIGFDCLVTTGFNVDTAYESQECNGPKKFVGYRVRQNLRVGVDFDKERLGVILDAIAQSEAARNSTCVSRSRTCTRSKRSCSHNARRMHGQLQRACAPGLDVNWGRFFRLTILGTRLMSAA